MASSKNLLNLCFNAVYDKGKALVDRVGNSGQKEQQLQSTLYHLIRVFKLWSLPTVIQQYKNNEWKVCVQDLNNAADSITITLSLQSSTEFGRFEAFLRHLINNWFRGLNVKKLDNDYLSLLVTHPVPVLIHILPQKYTNGEELLPVSASSNVETVSRIIRHLLEDFCLCAQNESGRLSGDSKEKFQTKKTLKIKSDADEYPTFQKREDDIFTSDFHYNSDTSSEVLLDQLKQAFASALNASQKSQSEEKRVALEANSEIRRLKAENEKLKKRFEAWSYDKEAETKALQVQVNELKENCNAMAMAVAQKDAEIQENLSELGRLSVELTRAENEKKRGELFTKTFKLHAAATQTSDFPEWSASSLDTRRSRGQATSSGISRTEDGSNEHEGHHGQESLNEAASLSDMPRTGVDATIYYNYKLLFLRIAGDLLNEDVLKLKRWVEAEFQIDTSGDVNAILLELDRKKIISVTDLSRLKKFFETNPRFDLVCLIDSYLCGDYGQLKKTSGALRASSRGANSQNALSSQRFARPPQWQSRAATRERYTGISHGLSRDIAPSGERKIPGLSRPNTREAQTGDGGGVSTQQTTHRPDAGSGLLSRKPRTVSLPQTSTSASRAKETVRSRNNTTQQRALVADGGTREEHEVQASGSDQSNTARNTTLGSNGQKLSKFQRPEDDDSQWLCSHYKRRCYVKFECCNKFWPCHRCHNNQSTCGRRKLKSRDTTQVKCVACNQEQPFGQFCSRCNAKFARYFCGLCKHLTGTDDKPYHCEKCGICRIHGDRSFHCDVCGVCLDVQLRGNHKCRAGSAHDECCICLEDAFTGCQILPCSHKVHKECATQMIRSGITRCPICRESFAHKLERRPFKKPP